MLALGCLAPTFEPRATQYIPQMLNLIGKLEEKGFAYHAADGDVDYAVRKFPNYGRLSGKSIDDLQSGARVQEREGKHDPLDFVLWKSAKPGEPQWDSKWGCGRPGWHIECSAMAMDLLGETIDIHGGGPGSGVPASRERNCPKRSSDGPSVCAHLDAFGAAACAFGRRQRRKDEQVARQLLDDQGLLSMKPMLPTVKGAALSASVLPASQSVPQPHYVLVRSH